MLMQCWNMPPSSSTLTGIVIVSIVIVISMKRLPMQRKPISYHLKYDDKSQFYETFIWLVSIQFMCTKHTIRKQRMCASCDGTRAVGQLIKLKSYTIDASSKCATATTHCISGTSACVLNRPLCSLGYYRVFVEVRDATFHRVFTTTRARTYLCHPNQRYIIHYDWLIN